MSDHSFFAAATAVSPEAEPVEAEAVPDANEDIKMGHVTLSSSAADELAKVRWEDSVNGVMLSAEDGRTVGVLLHPEEYQLLRAMADLASEPEELLEMIKEGERVRVGTADNYLTLEQVFK